MHIFLIEYMCICWVVGIASDSLPILFLIFRVYNVSSNYAVCGCRLLLSNGVWQDASEVLGLMVFDM